MNRERWLSLSLSLFLSLSLSLSLSLPPPSLSLSMFVAKTCGLQDTSKEALQRLCDFAVKVCSVKPQDHGLQLLLVTRRRDPHSVGRQNILGPMESHDEASRVGLPRASAEQLSKQCALMLRCPSCQQFQVQSASNLKVQRFESLRFWLRSLHSLSTDWSDLLRVSWRSAISTRVTLSHLSNALRAYRNCDSAIWASKASKL